MSIPSAPAPLWRRIAAAGYDGLLLIAIWMVALLLDLVIRDLLGAPRDWTALRVYLFGVGLLFFGWFWTHGGQTLGMRVWRLRVERDDGRALSWITAMSRFAAMLAVWSVILIVPLSRLPHLRDLPHAGPVALGCTLAAALGLLAMHLDRRRRSPHDWLSGAHVVQLPPRVKAPKP